ncbi:hypothetical protein FB451DRAFT_1184314 [Mycena latifolia]|nr:hypothetical protein FB451DRAFT_1184314 [Mycena latifolia]
MSLTTAPPRILPAFLCPSFSPHDGAHKTNVAAGSPSLVRHGHERHDHERRDAMHRPRVRVRRGWTWAGKRRGASEENVGDPWTDSDTSPPTREVRPQDDPEEGRNTNGDDVWRRGGRARRARRHRRGHDRQEMGGGRPRVTRTGRGIGVIASLAERGGSTELEYPHSRGESMNRDRDEAARRGRTGEGTIIAMDFRDTWNALCATRCRRARLRSDPGCAHSGHREGSGRSSAEKTRNTNMETRLEGGTPGAYCYHAHRNGFEMPLGGYRGRGKNWPRMKMKASVGDIERKEEPTTPIAMDLRCPWKTLGREKDGVSLNPRLAHRKMPRVEEVARRKIPQHSSCFWDATPGREVSVSSAPGGSSVTGRSNPSPHSPHVPVRTAPDRPRDLHGGRGNSGRMVARGRKSPCAQSPKVKYPSPLRGHMLARDEVRSMPLPSLYHDAIGRARGTLQGRGGLGDVRDDPSGTYQDAGADAGGDNHTTGGTARGRRLDERLRARGRARGESSHCGGDGDTDRYRAKVRQHTTAKGPMSSRTLDTRRGRCAGSCGEAPSPKMALGSSGMPTAAKRLRVISGSVRHTLRALCGPLGGECRRGGETPDERAA